MEEWEKISELQEFLEEHAHYEGSEAGEYWSALASFGSRVDMMGSPMKAAYLVELEETVAWIKEHYEFIEEEVTRTYKEKTLEWIED